MLDYTGVFTTFPVLETARFTLREIADEDTGDILRLMGDPEVNRYLGRFPMASLEEAQKRLKIYQNNFHEQSGMVWAIVPHGEEHLIGTCLLWNLDKTHARAELGYSIIPQWWGKGVVPEAATAALNFAFGKMGLHSVEAHIDPTNNQSRRVLEKLGFVQEGYFCENYYDPRTETFTDTAVFSLLQSTWINRKTQQP